MGKNLDRWNFYCRDFESPDLFIVWTFYTMISASLQRRVWIGREGHKEIYPNMYSIFIGPPGVGKTAAANEAMKLFKSFDNIFDSNGRPKSLFKVAPNSITLEALTRYLHNNYVTTPWPSEFNKPKGAIYVSSPLVFFCGNELGTLIKENQNDLVVFLNEGWDAGDFYRETKTQGSDVIKNMCITMLGSATPEWVKNVVGSRMLNEGFSARAIFVYGGEKRKSCFLYEFNDEQVAEFKLIREHVEKLSKVFGMIPLAGEALKWCEEWYASHKPINPDKKLLPYYERKKIHLLKLAMAVHFSDSTSLELTVSDLETALKLLTETEKHMHKALCASGENPINAMAMDILEFLEKRDHATHKEILMEFFDMGDADQLITAEQFLLDTQQITLGHSNGVPCFRKVMK